MARAQIPNTFSDASNIMQGTTGTSPVPTAKLPKEWAQWTNVSSLLGLTRTA